MRYAKYINCDLVNGSGVRCTLFLTGCIHGCKGCYNTSTWNKNSGEKVTQELIDRILDDLKDKHGLSLSGGDPMHLDNRYEVYRLCQLVKERYPDKNIWMWTGYKAEELKSTFFPPILNVVDVIIDGKFEKSNPTNKPFRGSDNQKRYRVENGSLILVD